MYVFEDKVVLVTGASQGIGLAVAEAFREHGARVHITGTRPTPQSYEADLSGFTYHAVDLGNEAARKELVAAVGDLDILVNNAGISTDNEYEMDDFRHVIEVNLFAVMELNLAFLDILETRGGNIINMGSVASFLSLREVPAYTTSKGGLVAMTRALADKWAPRGIRVNMIAPGFIETAATSNMRVDKQAEKRMISTVPLRRWGEPKEVAGAALYLASDYATYVTGSSVVVDGGLMVR